MFPVLLSVLTVVQTRIDEFKVGVATVAYSTHRPPPTSADMKSLDWVTYRDVPSSSCRPLAQITCKFPTKYFRRIHRFKLEKNTHSPTSHAARPAPQLCLPSACYSQPSAPWRTGAHSALACGPSPLASTSEVS